ncbi:MAG: HAD-IA family hydrolase [Saprospiraceae bacterium]|nr:HAD-IA family hydrolase [Saprospiraceae bacterium]
MVKLVIFDMAGTSINEDNLVYKTIQRMMTLHGVAVSLDTVLELGAGKEKRTAIADIAEVVVGSKGVSSDWVDNVHQAFKEALDQAYETEHMEVFPSVHKVVKKLRTEGIKVGFNTGYSRPVAERILARCGVKVGEDIDALATADDAANGRPAPDMIDFICHQLDIPAKHSVKIGDSAIDIEEGRSAGVKLAIGVTTGAQTRELIAKAEPDHILDDMLELLPILGLEE